MKKLLEIQELRTYFFMPGYVLRAVDGVSFSVSEGETLGIVGESGCGKSQTSLSIMGLIPSPPGKIVGGEITFEDTKLVHSLPEEEYRKIRGNDISMIFQEPMTSLNPIFTIGYQIAEALILHRDMEKKEALEEAGRLLKEVGISDPENRIKEYPFQLSGGLRQRVMIAMTMACRPKLLIADEPTTALDVTIQAQILRLIRDLTEKNNMATMFITHDLAVIASFTKRVIVMYAGVIVEDAPVLNIFKEPLHPYTQGLLNSIPVLSRKQTGSRSKNLSKNLQPIPGNLPDPKIRIKGCKFASRCPKVMKKCRESEPALVETEAGRRVRCFLYSDTVRENPSITDLEYLSALGGKHWRREFDRWNKTVETV
ncbi:MAG: ABC transporter ATP-binding protein [Salinispira sp.]